MKTNWIAIAYDSAHEYALGDSAEEAQANYREQIGEPPLGFFSVIVSADDHAKEYKRAAKALELEGVPVYLAPDWVIVAQITDDGVKVLEGKKSPAKRLQQGLVGGVFMLDALPHLLKESSKERSIPGETIMGRRKRRKAERQNIQPINGIEPSQRQRKYAVQHYVNWLDEMAWAHNKGELTLTDAEIVYARARYGDYADEIHVNKAYRGS